MIQNGTITIQNEVSGEHRTFKIHTVRDGKLEGKRIVSLLTGSDNESSYTGFGFVSNSCVNVWTKKQSSTFRFYAQIIEKAFEAIQEAYEASGETVDVKIEHLSRTYTVRHEKRCLCCNRKLTTPASLKAGYGPECAARLGISR
jgi:hypothetical protein